VSYGRRCSFGNFWIAVRARPDVVATAGEVHDDELTVHHNSKLDTDPVLTLSYSLNGNLKAVSRGAHVKRAPGHWHTGPGRAV